MKPQSTTPKTRIKYKVSHLWSDNVQYCDTEKEAYKVFEEFKELHRDGIRLHEVEEIFENGEWEFLNADADLIDYYDEDDEKTKPTPIGQND